MSRKPQTGTKYHDASALNCTLHPAAVRQGVATREDRTCLKCSMLAAGRRRAVRA